MATAKERALVTEGKTDKSNDQDPQYLEEMAKFIREHEVYPDIDDSDFTEKDTEVSSEETDVEDSTVKKRHGEGPFGVVPLPDLSLAMFSNDEQENFQTTNLKRKEPQTESIPPVASFAGSSVLESPALNRTKSFRIPEDFNAERAKKESAAYVCVKCGHQGDINGCSCEKPGITGKKWFRYKCIKHCGREFVNRRDYIDHERMSQNVRPFPCDICDKTFTSKNLLGKHVKVHIGDKPFTCEECHKQFMYKHIMLNHTRIHTEEKRFICDQCGKAYGTENNLIIHKLVHENKEPFRCKTCEKPFPYKKQRDVHEKFHYSGEGPFPCSHCGKPFKCRSNLSWHMKRMHKQLYQDIFTCYACRDKFKSSEELMKHCKPHYTEPRRNCKSCWRSFETQVELESHRCPQHLEDTKSFKCDLCMSGFLQEQALQRHRRTHFGEMPHSCVICAEPFPSRVDLSRHLKDHIQKDKGYKCRFCDKVFSGAGNLMRHHSTHNISDSTPFECTVCKKKFKMKRYLARHKKIHSDTKP